MNLQEYNNVVGSISQEFAETSLSIHQLFQWSVKRMHEMYELPFNVTPSLDNLGESPLQRMTGFMKTLQKEMDEGKEILALLTVREATKQVGRAQYPVNNEIYNTLCEYGIDNARAIKVEVDIQDCLSDVEDRAAEFDRLILVALADWLGDMTVYNRSEALKYGIPLESVLACIMGSNFTKLGEDGLPIKDENGKVLKGPNFVPPERAIYATMFEHEQLVAEAQTVIEAASSLGSVALPILQDPMVDVLYAGDDEEWDDDEIAEELDDDEIADHSGNM